MTTTENRSKKDRTIYEFKNNRPSYLYNDDYLEFIRYPKESEISFMNYQNFDFREAYETFIKNELNGLRNDFIRLIKEK